MILFGHEIRGILATFFLILCYSRYFSTKHDPITIEALEIERRCATQSARSNEEEEEEGEEGIVEFFFFSHEKNFSREKSGKFRGEERT